MKAHCKQAPDGQVLLVVSLSAEEAALMRNPYRLVPHEIQHALFMLRIPMPGPEKQAQHVRTDLTYGIYTGRQEAELWNRQFAQVQEYGTLGKVENLG